ncbi:TetR family transcriptional regulator [Stackebrandtia endophytica]|uniref:TetR family transcriptional regulator n=1 Tax=Stackebrandtia endophytica TaxID=1496996 RepID=A0A543AS74_9ACTN|nr:TetR/AcrR family transcriptional regulator [Stackebrandtia endophytica]TQL75430.1 TetR family transcriptional regulator [Stackebrandtia endophytica]
MAPRSIELSAAMRAATATAIQTAAIRLFAERGYANSSIRDIAEAAGISTGSVYRHYRSKEALFADLVAQASAGLAKAGSTLRDGESPHRTLLTFTRELIADIEASTEAAAFLAVINQAFITNEPEGTRHRLRDDHMVFRRAVADTIARGQRLGQFGPGDPHQLAACYLATLHGLAALRPALGEAAVVPAPELILEALTRGSSK